MSERLTTEQIAEIQARRAAIVTQWEYYPSRMAILAGIGHSEPQVTATVYDDVTGRFIAHAPDDIDALLTEIAALKADNERLRERVALLEQPRESMLEQARRILRGVNTDIGQEGD